MDIVQESKKLPDPYFSLTRLWTYSRCPRLYYYRYVEEHFEPILYSPLSGAALHAGLEVHNRLRFFEGKNDNIFRVREKDFNLNLIFFLLYDQSNHRSQETDVLCQG